MQIKIFTLPFDEETEGFPDEIIAEFCLNKKVLRIETQFFRKERQPYWSVAVHYELVLVEADKLRELDDGQKLLFQRLKEWRKEMGNKEGIPVYLVATNAQFIQMIRLKCRTLESFKNVKGFGKKRVQKYGKRIGNLTSQFFANVYLNGFDYFVKQRLRVRHYIRYMDNFVLFSNEKSMLKRYLHAIDDYLEENLKLQLKVKATFINSAPNGLTFLGRRIFPKTIRFARPNLWRMLRRMEIRQLEYEKGEITEDSFLQSMNSYWAALQHDGSANFRNKLLEDNG